MPDNKFFRLSLEVLASHWPILSFLLIGLFDHFSNVLSSDQMNSFLSNSNRLPRISVGLFQFSSARLYTGWTVKKIYMGVI